MRFNLFQPISECGDLMMKRWLLAYYSSLGPIMILSLYIFESHSVFKAFLYFLLDILIN